MNLAVEEPRLCPAVVFSSFFFFFTCLGFEAFLYVLFLADPLMAGS